MGHLTGLNEDICGDENGKYLFHYGSCCRGHSCFGFTIVFILMQSENSFNKHSIFLKVERTKTRPLAAKDMTNAQALGFLGGILSCGLMILLSLNWYR